MKKIRAAGGDIIKGRGKGGHILVRLNGRATTIPLHGDNDIDPDFLDDICKQLGTRLRSLP
ncbi:MAG: type II toxin-antitoxin system HicA family toxin [Candidatus Ozemobacteraceae bacterium]